MWGGLCVLLKRIFQKCFFTNKWHHTKLPADPGVADPGSFWQG